MDMRSGNTMSAAPISVIEAHGVERVFEMGSTRVRALRGVDLTVEPGEMIAIMGASGSGKSTLMNILGCLDRPSAGSYAVEGARVEQLDNNELADIRNRRIGFVFQGFNLLPRTSALENVELPLLYDRSGRDLDTKRLAAEALVRVALADRMDHDPSELSGGQQQRVAIARALVTRPSLVLADEPTGNLDTVTSKGIMALFQRLNAQGVTLLIVTHEAEISRYAQRIVELRDGRVVRDEPVTDRGDAQQDLEATRGFELAGAAS